MSIAVDSLPPYALHASASSSNGAVGGFVLQELQEAFINFQQTSALWGGYHTALAELDAIYAECKKANWDGDDARPVSVLTYRSARAFLDALPLGLPAPTLCAESDGQVSFDWFGAPGARVSASIGDSNVITYAAVYGRGSLKHGIEQFDGRHMPYEISASVERLVES